MSKYAELDSKILSLIQNGCDTFQSLSTRLGVEAQEIPGVSGEGWRIIDRRLQALRKAGKVSAARRMGRAIWMLEMPDSNKEAS